MTIVLFYFQLKTQTHTPIRTRNHKTILNTNRMQLQRGEKVAETVLNRVVGEEAVTIGKVFVASQLSIVVGCVFFDSPEFVCLTHTYVGCCCVDRFILCTHTLLNTNGPFHTEIPVDISTRHEHNFNLLTDFG